MNERQRRALSAGLRRLSDLLFELQRMAFVTRAAEGRRAG